MVMQSDHSGFRDWIIQRISAVIIGLYALFIVIYLLTNQPLYYAQWSSLFGSLWMKMATFITFVAALWHAWLGLEIIVLLLIAGYLIWILEILWG